MGILLGLQDDIPTTPTSITIRAFEPLIDETRAPSFLLRHPPLRPRSEKEPPISISETLLFYGGLASPNLPSFPFPCLLPSSTSGML
jgi:hypothetical protein